MIVVTVKENQYSVTVVMGLVKRDINIQDNKKCTDCFARVEPILEEDLVKWRRQC